MQSYQQYRSYGHPPLTALILAIPLWALLLVGIIAGFGLALLSLPWVR